MYPFPPSETSDRIVSQNNPSYNVIEEDQDKAEDEINYLELDHQQPIPVTLLLSRTIDPASIRESNNNQEDLAEHYQGPYAEIDITSTQALNNLRSSNNDLHAASVQAQGTSKGQVLKHDSTLDSIHSVTTAVTAGAKV